MRKISQGGTSFISVREHNSETEIGLIMQSTIARRTEIDALVIPYVPHTEVVTDKPPHPGDVWCSVCGWRSPNRFSKDATRKSGYDKYCKECRRKKYFARKILPHDGIDTI